MVAKFMLSTDILLDSFQEGAQQIFHKKVKVAEEVLHSSISDLLLFFLFSIAWDMIPLACSKWNSTCRRPAL